MMQRLFFMMIFFLSLSLESCSKEDDNLLIRRITEEIII